MRGFPWLLLLALSLCACPRRPPAPSEPPAPRYLKGQLHLHSSRSGDSRTSPDEVVRWYGERGFDFIVFTDHNRIGLPLPSAGPLVLSGIELTQNVPDCTPPPATGEQCLFHVNALLVDPRAAGFDPWRPEPMGDRLAAYRQGLAAAARAGGLAQLNHPNFHHGADAALLTTLAREHGLRFFEVANGSFDAGNDGDANHPSTEELWDRVLTAGGWLYGTATDDAHHYADAASVGARGRPVYPGDRGFVMVRATRDETSIRAALLRGDFYASNGVLLSRAEASDGALHIEVAPASPGNHKLQLVGTGGKIVAESLGRGASFSLGQAPPGYVRAVVEDEQHRKAWLQPIQVPR